MVLHGFPWLTTLIPVAVQFVIFLRWLHRRMRNEEITRAFAAQQGIELDETPMVRFVDLNHHRRRT
jgi:hypothetical protein